MNFVKIATQNKKKTLTAKKRTKPCFSVNGEERILFDTTHFFYRIVSAVITAAALVLATRLIKREAKKELFLKLIAVVTVVLHYSSIWVEFFGNGGSTDGLEGSHLFPIYPCHIMMWLLFIAAFLKNKSGVVFRTFAEFCFWGGLVCGSIGILLNENYASTPSLLDWGVFKGLLSHSTLLLGCIYMRVGGFMKIRVFNVVSVAAGLITLWAKFGNLLLEHNWFFLEKDAFYIGLVENGVIPKWSLMIFTPTAVFLAVLAVYGLYYAGRSWLCKKEKASA